MNKHIRYYEYSPIQVTLPKESTIRIKDAERICGIPAEVNDWRQGYCYQMWRGTHNTVRADGAGGQYILLVPDKNAVVILTSWSSDLQRELDFIWKFIYPNL